MSIATKDRAWVWSAVQEEAFSKVKTAICLAPTLVHYESTYTAVCWQFVICFRSSDVRLYAHSKDDLTYGDGILIFDERVAAPLALRPRILDAFHAAHQGIVKSRAKARQTVWWPKVSACREQRIGACATSAHWPLPVVELLLLSQLPNCPWQKVATDLSNITANTTSLWWIFACVISN